MARIKDKTLFGWLRNIFKQGDGGVHNDQHESLSDDDKVVEDYLEVSKFIIKRMRLTNVVGVDCDLVSEKLYPLSAILEDGSTVELDHLAYVHHDDADMTERLMEIESIICDCDREYIQERVIEEARHFYSNK